MHPSKPGIENIMQESRRLVRVLLVDDDPDDQLLIGDQLARLGTRGEYLVQVVNTYQAALSALQRHEHDVVLVDYRLGAYTGADLLSATAHDALRPPMIVLTGWDNNEIDQRCLSAGAADFIVKSTINSESLSRCLRYTLERHRLGQLLAKSERDYRALFDASPMSMWVFDPSDRRILEINDAATEQYGYSREEFLALTISDLRAEGDETHDVVLCQENTSSVRYLRAGVWRHLCQSRKFIDVEINCSDILFGNTRARLAIINNVTARMRAEDALKASETTLRQVLRDSADGLLVTNRGNRILFANPEASRILGQSESELLGAMVPTSLSGSLHETVEFHGVQDKPQLLDVRVSETLWNGETARVLNLHDVTMQRKNAQQLILLSRAIEATNDGLLIADARLEGHPIIYVNPAFERITGYAADDAKGRGLLFLNREDNDHEILDNLSDAMFKQCDCVVELRQSRKGGGLLWSRMTLSPVREAGTEVSHYVAALTDISEQKRLEAEHKYLSTYDAVTGLLKYVGSEARIDQLMKGAGSVEARSSGHRLAFLFIDLDNFNTINDTMGFAVGDMALRMVAKRLRSIAGPDAGLFRYAGDEFLIVFDVAAADTDLLKLACTFCEGIAEPLLISPNTTLHLSASAGISAFPDTGTTALELTRQAEIATNRAKRGGRNGAFVFGQELREALGDRMALGGRMRDALRNGEFLLHYQPQVNAQDGALTGVEALVRWDSPEFGLLPPRRFVPIAEDSGMILQLGAWVLASACQQLRRWMDEGLRGFVVSVNISAAQLQRPSIVDDVRRTILESGIDPNMLELELTESVLMGNADYAVAQMLDLKQLGVRLVLDDFGMGYSSLSYLRRFPIDKLKIDQSFIANIVHEANDAALVRAMIAMGHHLGLRVVAEGVETAAQMGYLRRAHCDEFQGHYFARAMTADEIPEIIHRRYLLPSSLSEDAHLRTLLILDDEENIRRSLMRLLRRDGYHILEASCATEAFELLATNRAQVILSDQRMPGMSGTAFLSQIKEMYPDTIRMVLSGFTDLESVTEAINRGAIYKFLTKPWDDEALRAQVLEAFRQHELAGGV
jgi:diguanylate cyclase (GGDEF)-like protein/PAS domain S-box-containing protein